MGGLDRGQESRRPLGIKVNPLLPPHDPTPGTALEGTGGERGVLPGVAAGGPRWLP